MPPIRLSTDLAESPGGYATDAQCSIEGEPEERYMVQAMLVEGASTLPDTGHVYCGAVEGED